MLEYLYAEKIDCIYIDPPYNNRAKTWKYNNDYVDPSDDYRHSKWLSMIEKRLKIAKRLLNPTNSVLIVTIDEREYIHLGCLLEEMFPSARMQMISSVINPAGAGRQTEFSRTDEYIYILQFGEQTILPESREVENVPIIWDTLRRSSLANARGRHGKGACGPNQFYPIYVFFAGSGTTLHSVNLINSEDNGNRRCIMITNNEVSSLEAAQLEQEGLHPGDDRWEQYGAAKYVTWPRTKCSILGIDINGNALPGEYGVEIEKYIPDTSSRGKYIKATQQVYPQLNNASLSDGFKANAAFFHLGFLDKTSVAVGRQFRELLPLLWLKAGAHNSCPVLPDDGDLPDLLVLPGNRFAVLLSETSFADFAAQVKAHPEIDTLYIVTDSEPAFRMMTDTLPGRTAYQLYRDYLENFQINLRR